MRGLDSDQRPPGYEPDELPLLYPASTSTILQPFPDSVKVILFFYDTAILSRILPKVVIIRYNIPDGKSQLGKRTVGMNETKLMSEGPIGGAMIRFAVPLFLGNLFQQLYHTVDSLIVGNLLGNQALAALSSTGMLIDLMVGFSSGLFIGAGVVVSRYFGAHKEARLKRAVHTTILAALILGLGLTLLGTLMTPTFLHWMGTPEEIFEMASAYVRVYFLGSLGLIFYNACVGIMQAVGDSKHPLYYLMISSVINVALDFLFVGGFGWDVSAAAWATIISQFVSAGFCLVRLTRTQDIYRLSVREVRWDGEMFVTILKFGLPSAVSNSIINFANVIVQSNINYFGTMAVSGCGAYSKLEGFSFLPITSFNSAITTFVSQNLGAKEYERAQKGSRFGIFCAICLAEFFGILMYVFAPVLVSAFTKEPEAIAFGVEKCRICALFNVLLAATHSISSVLRGAGKANVPMIVMLGVWCIFRVTFISVLTPMLQTIKVVDWVYPLTWSISTVILTIYYFKADWIHGLE